MKVALEWTREGILVRIYLPVSSRIWVWRRAAVAMAAIAFMQCGIQSRAQDGQAAPVPVPPVAWQHRIPSAQLAFLNDYAGKTTKEVMKDKRFRALLKEMTPSTEYHYGRDMPLRETIETMLDDRGLPVDIRDGRYVMVAGNGGPYLSGRGFLWFDLQEGIALGGVYFHPTNGEPTPTLAVFSKQLNATALSMMQLPEAFAEDVAQWSLIARVPAVTVRYFIPENGKKYVLVHDEEYCSYGPRASGPPQTRCEQMDADAADADMNGAAFMRDAHNAANATAWMLAPEQVAWIGVRERTCGAGLACRIQMTRRRTQMLLTH
jgi:hypothetical protein